MSERKKKKGIKLSKEIGKKEVEIERKQMKCK